jgi:hypothetical protein
MTGEQQGKQIYQKDSQRDTSLA